MATDLFDAALQNEAIISEITSAVEQEAGSVDTTEEAQAVVTRAASDSEFKNNLSTQLQAVASANGASLNLTKLITAGSYAAGMAFAATSIIGFNSQQPKPEQLKFAAAAAIFAPS